MRKKEHLKYKDSRKAPISKKKVSMNAIPPILYLCIPCLGFPKISFNNIIYDLVRNKIALHSFF